MYINCHTYYSFKYGTLSIDELLSEGQKNGLESLVLTDINNTSACLDFIKKASQYSIKPIVGIDFRNGVQQQFIGIAKNNLGFAELNRYLTYVLSKKLKIPAVAPAFNDSYVIYPFHTYDSNSALAQHEYVGVTISQLSRMGVLGSTYDASKFVILHPVTFRYKRDFNAHRLLRAVDKNTLLSKLSQSEEGNESHKMLPISELREIYKRHPQIIKNTEKLLESCDIGFELNVNRNKSIFTDSINSDLELLKRKTYEGLTMRFGNPSKIVKDRMETELKVIIDLGFCPYFLINWDIINYAKSKDYFHVGRGSGANSLVAYLLGITDVDPVELDLYFERFINPYRTTPPDFDIDFNWTDRDDITQYIFEKHGYEHVSLLGTYITFQHKSVIREIGKVFGLPSFEIDKLQRIKDPRLADEIGSLVLKYGALISEFPSHLSVHSSGILVADNPTTDYTATFIPPKGFPTTQFSMLEAEDIGLHKLDILSQRGLGKIRDTLTIVKENKGIDIDINDFDKFKKDEKIKDLLRNGKTIGCFYVESPAMRMLLKKLEADDYLRLVAASSIIRPGVAKSGMMREYILRFRDKNRREKARNQLPELYDLMKETYGVMVYQEDVIKVAHYFGGLTLAEADHLRRGMSWKFRERSEFWKAKDAFFNNCMAKGHPKRLIEEIWTQIESFANYAFAKGHSASYAVESYQALYLKAHFPLEYMVATVNNFGGFYRQEMYLHEAKKHGGTIIAPTINISEILTKIAGDKIYLGFSFIQGLESKNKRRIIKERNEYGDFVDLQSFIDRVPISLEQLVLLIRAEAFSFIDKTKKELLWQAHMSLSKHEHGERLPQLFSTTQKKNYTLPTLTHEPIEDAYDQIELLGFSLNSPFGLLKEKITTQLVAKDLERSKGKTIQIVGNLITIKNTRTSKGDYMYFGTFLDLEGEWLDTVHFPLVAKRYPFKGKGCYLLQGKTLEEFGFMTLQVSAMWRLENKSMEDV